MTAQLERPKEVVFEFPQPPHPYPPSQRSGAFIGPSGVGKSSTAISLLLGPYKNVYSRVYVFSPSCAEGVDSAWDAWRSHVRIHMRVPDEEQTMWSTWEPQVLEKLTKRHQHVNAHLKAKKAQEGVRNFSLGGRFRGCWRQSDAFKHKHTDKPLCTRSSLGMRLLDVDPKAANR